MSNSAPPPDRSFGLSVGSVLCAIAALLALYGRVARAGALAIAGALLIAFAVIQPARLERLNRVWWRISRALGYVNARVLLTMLFAAAIVPLGLVWKMIGKDPLARRRATWRGWSPHPARYRDTNHYERMF